MMNFSYVRLLVTDFSACFRFYTDKLGFTVKHGHETGSYAELQTGDVTIALFTRQMMAEAIGTTDLPAQAAAQDRAALIFAVENVDAATAHLKASGISFVAEPTDRPEWDIRTAHFRDPDGNLIEINARLA